MLLWLYRLRIRHWLEKIKTVKNPVDPTLINEHAKLLSPKRFERVSLNTRELTEIEVNFNNAQTLLNAFEAVLCPMREQENIRTQMQGIRNQKTIRKISFDEFLVDNMSTPLPLTDFIWRLRGLLDEVSICLCKAKHTNEFLYEHYQRNLTNSYLDVIAVTEGLLKVISNVSTRRKRYK